MQLNHRLLILLSKEIGFIQGYMETYSILRILQYDLGVHNVNGDDTVYNNMLHTQEHINNIYKYLKYDFDYDYDFDCGYGYGYNCGYGYNYGYNCGYGYDKNDFRIEKIFYLVKNISKFSNIQLIIKNLRSPSSNCLSI